MSELVTPPSARDFEAVAGLLEGVAWGLERAESVLELVIADAPKTVRTGVGMAWGFFAPKAKVIAGQCARVAAACRYEVERRREAGGANSPHRPSAPDGSPSDEGGETPE